MIECMPLVVHRPEMCYAAECLAAVFDGQVEDVPLAVICQNVSASLNHAQHPLAKIF